jgi:hypothetical protein
MMDEGFNLPQGFTFDYSQHTVQVAETLVVPSAKRIFFP